MSLLLTLGLGGSGTPPTPPSGGDTPYMNLLLPTVSVTLGPLYATEVNQAFLRVDSHDHSDGYGKLVGTNGLNVNADLSFHGFGATNLDSVGFNIRSHTAGLVGSVYMSGEDLYCVDGSGNVIQITAAGAVNVSGLGSWTGLVAPAQASYSSVTKKFALQSNTTGPVYGLLAVGDILLYPGDPNLGTLPYIRLATPNAGVSTYTLQLPPAVPAGSGNKKLMLLNNDGTCTLGPTLPSVTSFLRMDSTGTPAADVSLDPTTLQLLGAGPYTLRVTPGGISTPQLANLSVTPAKLSAANIVSSAAITNNVSTTTPTQVVSVSLTTAGRPVSITLRHPTGSGFYYIDDGITLSSGIAELYMDGALVHLASVVSQALSVPITMAGPALSTTLQPAAGAHTFAIKLRCSSSGGLGTMNIDHCILQAMEI